MIVYVCCFNSRFSTDIGLEIMACLVNNLLITFIFASSQIVFNFCSSRLFFTLGLPVLRVLERFLLKQLAECLCLPLPQWLPFSFDLTGFLFAPLVGFFILCNSVQFDHFFQLLYVVFSPTRISSPFSLCSFSSFLPLSLELLLLHFPI